MQITTKFINGKFANMSFVCCLLVVLIHCPRIVSCGGINAKFW